jgi:PPM family protein phosphatase
MVIVESAGISDVGRKRQSNEDHIFMDDAQGLYLVADGMGGHQAGNVASALVIQSIRDFLCEGESLGVAAGSHGRLSGRAQQLLAGIKWSNRVVHQTSTEHDHYQGMGSTVAAVYFSEDTMIAANVGDSPIYLVRNGRINLLSVPHTLLADLPSGTHTPLFGHILTRAVGPKNAVEADICELNCFKGDILIVCSDGLSTKVTPQEIIAITSAQPPALACRELVELANERGGDDNISAVVLRVVGVRPNHDSAFGKWADRIKRRLTSIAIKPNGIRKALPRCHISH